MNTPVKIASLVSLLLVVVPCLLFIAGSVNLSVVKWTALVGTIGWFIATPLWMSRDLSADASEVEM
jgi:hypothetical protein